MKTSHLLQQLNYENHMLKMKYNALIEQLNAVQQSVDEASNDSYGSNEPRHESRPTPSQSAALSFLQDKNAKLNKVIIHKNKQIIDLIHTKHRVKNPILHPNMIKEPRLRTVPYTKDGEYYSIDAATSSNKPTNSMVISRPHKSHKSHSRPHHRFVYPHYDGLYPYYDNIYPYLYNSDNSSSSSDSDGDE